MKREAIKMQRREEAGIVVKKAKITNRDRKDETELYGELEDLWSAPTPAKSKEFKKYQDRFAKKDMINVKSVVLPKGGISYNPSQADHVKVLKDVATVEEACVMQELKNLKKVHPLEYAEKNEEDEDNS